MLNTSESRCCPSATADAEPHGLGSCERADVAASLSILVTSTSFVVLLVEMSLVHCRFEADGAAWTSILAFCLLFDTLSLTWSV